MQELKINDETYISDIDKEKAHLIDNFKFYKGESITHFLCGKVRLGGNSTIREISGNEEICEECLFRWMAQRQ